MEGVEEFGHMIIPVTARQVISELKIRVSVLRTCFH